MPDFIDPAAPSTCDGTADSLVSCLVFLEQNDPELAAIVSAWPTLPEAVRRGILAMVKASDQAAE